MTATTTQTDAIQDVLRLNSQNLLLEHLSALNEDGKQNLQDQIRGLDFKLIQQLGELGRSMDPSAGSAKISPPDTITLAEVRQGSERITSGIERGAAELAAGRVGMLLVAGGQATRLGCDGPKGDFPIGPVSGWSLFMIHARRILAINQRYGVRVPWYVMTSQANDQETKDIFAANDSFGLPTEDVIFFTQKMLPALDLEGNVLLKDEETLFLAPNGHGGSLEAFASSGCLADAQRRGITTLSYFQVDNPLVRPTDPLFLGLHCNADAQMSSKVVQKRAHDEKVGVLGLIDGSMGCVEYSDMSPEMLKSTNEQGELNFSAGNIAVHAISIDFIKEITDGGLRLPWHVAKKKISCVAPGGQLSEVDGMKFETFVFDALGLAKTSVTLEVDRAAEFSPVKNRLGADSPDTARAALSALHSGWAHDAGLALPAPGEDGIVGIEIDPLIAEDSESFIACLPRTPLETPEGQLYY